MTGAYEHHAAWALGEVAVKALIAPPRPGVVTGKSCSRWLAAIGCIASVLARAGSLEVKIPGTPAAKMVDSWLAAFNSGDRDRIDMFDKTYAQWVPLDWALNLRRGTGGLELVRIEVSREREVIFRVRARARPDEFIGQVKVSGTQPPLITNLGLYRVQPGSRFEDVQLNASARRDIIESIASALNAAYVFPDTANVMATALRTSERRGTYKTLIDGQDFARQLTEDLWATSHDKHLRVTFNLVARQPGDAPAPSDAVARERQREATANCGFERAEHLAPNIGYLKFNEFADTDICARTASAAMTFLADSDALVIDLRDNHGGRTDMVTLLASYLFDQRTHLNDVYDRKTDATRQFWTEPDVSGRKFVGKPVYVLTSKATFSAAEDFSYALQMLKRATIIGETTGGGAHPVESRIIDAHYSLVVPVSRSISPISGKDWEGTGVEPDVRVPAADALNEAIKIARGSDGPQGTTIGQDR